MTTKRQYKPPEMNIVIHGSINSKVVESLNNILRRYGSKGLKIYLISGNSSPRVLEQIREFLQSNHAFTLEVYTVDESMLKDLQSRLGDLIIISSEPGLGEANQMPRGVE